MNFLGQTALSNSVPERIYTQRRAGHLVIILDPTKPPAHPERRGQN